MTVKEAPTAPVRLYKKGRKSYDILKKKAKGTPTVTAILDNKVYLGHTVGLRTTTISYKIKQRYTAPKANAPLWKIRIPR